MQKKLSIAIFSFFVLCAQLFASCTAEGTFRCVDNGGGIYDVQICTLQSGNTLDWLSTSISCGPNMACIIHGGGYSYSCLPIICDISIPESGCSDSSTRWSCINSGTERYSIPCNSGFECQMQSPTTSACVDVSPKICDPNVNGGAWPDSAQKYCEGNVKKVCNSAGTAYYVEPCGSGFACVQTSSTDAQCELSVCIYPDQKCENNAIYSCKADNSGWLLQENCLSTQTCVESGASPNKVASCESGITCTASTQMRCDGVQVQLCNAQGNGWDTIDTCISGEKCIYDSAANLASCQAQTSCTAGFYKCQSSSEVYQCNAQGNGWDSVGSCPQGTNCALIGGGLAFTCEATTCTQGQTRCSLYNPSNLELCNANSEWEYSKFCEFGCSNGACLAAECTDGEYACIGTSIFFCNYGTWEAGEDCSLLGKVCKKENNIAFCTSSESASSVSTSGGSSSGGLTGSGGGSFDSAKCPKLTEWSIESSKTKTESDSSGRTRECTNTTLVRWCVDKNGKIDSSIAERKYEYSCANWSGECEFVFSKTIKQVEKSGTMCRACQSDIYSYTCQPGSKIDASKAQNKTTCGQWYECAVNESVQGKPSTPSASESSPFAIASSMMQDFGIIIGIVLLVAIAYVLYGAFKGNKEEA